MRSNPFPAQASIEGRQVITGTCSEDDELTLYTGNLVKRVEVLNVDTVGWPLQFVLYNNTQDMVLGPVGYRWRHNYMMNLTFTGSPPTQITFTSNTGRPFSMEKIGAFWFSSSTTPFLSDGVLNPQGSGWTLAFPDGRYLSFDSTGNLVSMTDRHNNTTTLTYTGGVVTTVTEPTGRQIQLGYSGGLLTSITDPNGNVTSLFYTASDLTQIVGPQGCVLSYAYNNHLVISRTDANSHTTQYQYDAYSYDDARRLTGAIDAEGHSISYSYGTVDEWIGDSVPDTFPTTTLLDARGNTWQYVFDHDGNLWRNIDPKQHYRHFYWDSEQKLLYGAEGFPPNTDHSKNTFRDNPNSARTRYAYDASGNRLYEVDADGLITQYLWDAARNLTSIYPGRGHLGVQGHWVGQFGADGYLLCAFNSDASDLVKLPSYIASIVTNAPSRTNFTSNLVMDPRALDAPTSRDRSFGLWSASGGFGVSVQANQTVSFNLSIYTASADVPMQGVDSVGYYYEQFGRDVVLTVTDAVRTQTFRVYNNAPGAWVTFPVTANPNSVISIAISNTPASSNDAVISALAFDPYDSHETIYTYNGSNDLLTVTDPLNGLVQLTYNGDGTVASVEDQLLHTTTLGYDGSRNVSSIEDATLATTLLSYDANGNVLTMQDPLGSTHTWHYRYDAKNRLVSATDPLGNVTQLAYDGAGNLLTMTDARGSVTQFFYSPTNRLTSVVDAMGNRTSMSYDAAGNLVSVTDGKGNTTTFALDACHLPSQTTDPDGQLHTFAFDSFNRLRALTDRNANLADITQVNLQGALNSLFNPNGTVRSQVSPRTPAFWPNTLLDTGTVNTTTASINLNSGATGQRPLPMPDNGATVMLSMSARGDGSFSNESMTAQLVVSNNLAQTSTRGFTMPMPQAIPTPWTHGSYRTTLPGDAQTTLTQPPVSSVTFSPNSNAWMDSVGLYTLSPSFNYDIVGRLERTRMPDGSEVLYVRDRFGRLVKVVDARGHVTALSYDSLDRLTSVTDPLGNVVSYAWDAASNLTFFRDGNGNLTQYGYDAVNRLTLITYPDSTTEQFSYDVAGNLQTYTNNRSQSRGFTYDVANRLTLVTYNTDSTTVAFTYDRVGNVLSRQERNRDISVFQYDVLNRLVGVDRCPAVGNSTPFWHEAFGYDANGNRLQMLLDLGGSRYDQAQFDVARYASDLGARYDEAIFDTSLYQSANQAEYRLAHYGSDVYAGLAQYDRATYDSNNFGQSYQTLLNVDSLDRVTTFQDGQGVDATMSYDVTKANTALTGLSFRNATQTTATYDVMERLTNLTVQGPSGTLLPLSYQYDAASNRVAMATDTDSTMYVLDAAGRLVAEGLNVFVTTGADAIAQGDVWNATVTPSGLIELLDFSDSFGGATLNLDRWRPVFVENPAGLLPGFELRQSNGLTMTYPRGYHDLAFDWDLAQVLPAIDPYAYYLNQEASLEHRIQLIGDFDVQVTFSNFQPLAEPLPSNNPALLVLGLRLQDTHFEITPTNYATIGLSQTASIDHGTVRGYYSEVNAANTLQSSFDTSGMLRFVRFGALLTTYYWSAQLNAWVALQSNVSFTSGPLWLSLYLNLYHTTIAISYANLKATLYPNAGTYRSTVYDAGRTVNCTTLSFQGSQPAGSMVKFQVGTSNSPNGPWGEGYDVAVYDSTLYCDTFVGPDGTPATWITSPTQSLGRIPAGRFLRYQAILSGDFGTVPRPFYDVAVFDTDTYDIDTATPALTEYDTAKYDQAAYNVTSGFDYSQYDRSVYDGAFPPTLTQVALSFTGANPSTLSTYGYDPAGNMTSKVVAQAGQPTITETRTVNALNQITANAVVNGGGNETYQFDNSGNLVLRTNTTTGAMLGISADEDSHDTVFTLPSGRTITYSVDILGRILTRRDSNDAAPTQFLWDGFNLALEVAPDGTMTRYYTVNGVLRSFERNGMTYQCTHDALVSVVMVTDSTGTVVARKVTDVWGNPLVSSFDNVPNGGLAYGFVGGLGVRYDSTVNLYYVRRRWYDPGLGRFISRDPLRSINRYAYCFDNPSTFVDVTGLAPIYLRGDWDAAERLREILEQESGLRLSVDRNTRLLTIGGKTDSCGCPNNALALLLQDIQGRNITSRTGRHEFVIMASLSSGAGPYTGVYTAKINPWSIDAANSQLPGAGTGFAVHEINEALIGADAGVQSSADDAAWYPLHNKSIDKENEFYKSCYPSLTRLEDQHGFRYVSNGQKYRLDFQNTHPKFRQVQQW